MKEYWSIVFIPITTLYHHSMWRIKPYVLKEHYDHENLLMLLNVKLSFTRIFCTAFNLITASGFPIRSIRVSVFFTGRVKQRVIGSKANF